MTADPHIHVVANMVEASAGMRDVVASTPAWLPTRRVSAADGAAAARRHRDLAARFAS